jgi:hypothetical protein
VTIGILIALSLEGIRETIHEHRLVREARENFRIEMLQDQAHMKREISNVQDLSQRANTIIANLPTLAKNPAELKTRIDALAPSLYFFSSGSWTAALSSGALVHMSAEETTHYAGFDFMIHSYVGMQDRLLSQELDLHAYVDSRKTFGPQELADTEQRLRNFQSLVALMSNIGRQCDSTIETALPTA